MKLYTTHISNPNGINHQDTYCEAHRNDAMARRPYWAQAEDAVGTESAADAEEQCAYCAVAVETCEPACVLDMETERYSTCDGHWRCICGKPIPPFEQPERRAYEIHMALAKIEAAKKALGRVACPACHGHGLCRYDDELEASRCDYVPGIRIFPDGRTAFDDCTQCRGTGVYGFNACGQCDLRRRTALEGEVKKHGT